MLKKTLILLTSLFIFTSCGGTLITSAGPGPAPDNNTYIIAHKINVEIDVNGEVSSDGTAVSSGTITIGEASSKSFEFTPSTGYLVSNVDVDGVPQGAIATYSFINIKEDHSIAVQFKTCTTWAEVTAAIATTDCPTIKTALHEFSSCVTDYCATGVNPNEIKRRIKTTVIDRGICPIADFLTCESATLYARNYGCLGESASGCVFIRTFLPIDPTCNLNETIPLLSCIP